MRKIHSFLATVLLLISFTFAEEPLTNSVCASNPCINGVCTPRKAESDTESSNTTSADGYRCFCLEGFTGVHCEHRYDHCLPGRNRCQNNGTCVNQNESENSSSLSFPKCICQPGFCGRFCEDEVDDCASAPCLNGGICLDRHLGFRCLCPPGYLGDRCEADIDACSADFLESNLKPSQNLSRHCENNGLCIDGPGLSYSCRCGRGFTGSRCEAKIDYCLESPCQNGGRCRSGLGSFSCLCPYGWSGPLCDKPLKPCSNKNSANFCRNGGLCMEPSDEDSREESSSFSFTCFCAPDYHGRHCELRYDECTPNGCLNGGVCIDGIDGFSCKCEAGFGGQRCEVDCEANPEACLTTTTTTSTTPETPPPPSSPSSELPTINSSATTTSTTEVQLITPTPLPASTSHSLDPTLTRIFSPRFSQHSSLTFRVRRLKRRTSAVQFDLMISSTFSESTSSETILYANSSSSTSNSTYHLELSIQESQLKGRLWTSAAAAPESPILSLVNSYPLQPNIRYTIVLSLSENSSSEKEEKSLIGELNILNNSLSQELLSSVAAKSGSGNTVPCFETYQFGSSSFSFNGCLQKILLNGEEKYPKDAVQGAGIVECSSSVCKAEDSGLSEGENPCQNNGTCVEEGSTSAWNCHCPAGFGGWLCSEARCEEGFCQNGGLCLLTGAESSKDLHHLCVCTAGFKGARCEEKVNLTFPLFNVGPSGTSTSFLKYRLPFDLRQFFEVRFRFIAHQLSQRSALLMFMSSSSSKTKDLNSTEVSSPSSSDFISLLYSQRRVLLRLNLGQGERTLVSPIEANVTEQMVLFGRFHQTFWLLVVPATTTSTAATSSPPTSNSSLSPQVGRMPLHHRILNVDPYLWVGGHEDWTAHPALAGLVGFKGCIYDVELRAASPSSSSPTSSNWTRLDETLVERVANLQQCDFECT